MSEEKLYRWRITHPDFGELEVRAKDKLHAVYAVGRAWSTRWTGIARSGTIERLGECNGTE